MNLLNRTKNRVIALYSQPSTRTIINVSLFALITALFHYIWWGGLVQLLANYPWFESFRTFMVHAVFNQSVWINEHISIRPGYYVVIFLMWVLWIELFPVRFGAKTVTK